MKSFINHLNCGGSNYRYFDIVKGSKEIGVDLSSLPFSIRVLLENILRNCDLSQCQNAIDALAGWAKRKEKGEDILYFPARVLMQDFTGVPAVADLAAMRDHARDNGVDPSLVNPNIPVDLVIDHSVTIDFYGNAQAFEDNVTKEYERNKERYEFLKWGKKAFENFRVVPPGTGICHQVNLEYLSSVVFQKKTDSGIELFPDTLVGTDSHTTMVNGLGVLGWGVGGIEAEAAMLGQPLSISLPEVVEVRLKGSLSTGVTATDLVLTITEMLREKGVVGKFVEFSGEGMKILSLSDRATLSNMCPEYGATCSFFPVDSETVRYLSSTSRDSELVEEYCKQNGLWAGGDNDSISYQHLVELDLSDVEPSMAGPKRPQDRNPLRLIKSSIEEIINEQDDPDSEKDLDQDAILARNNISDLDHGDVVIASITSCTNTSNPSVMMGAAILAKNAIEKGLKIKPWVKTSLAPGSRVVTSYLEKSGLQKYLDKLGFHLVGYGCTTCIGNSGPLRDEINQIISNKNLNVASVLSGNRNFEGRVHPMVKLNYLASPILVVAYAIAGTLRCNLLSEPIGMDKNNEPVYLKDIWPSKDAINETIENTIKRDLFDQSYKVVFEGDDAWKKINISEGNNYSWDEDSTYIKCPPYFKNISNIEPKPFKNGRILALLGDSITTDHISPAGVIKNGSPAFNYLSDHGVEMKDMNSYGSRRGNHEVMVRGTFANIRLKNEMSSKEGGYTIHNGKEIDIYSASRLHQDQSVDLVIIAGKEYGTGSSRDWAAKGTLLLGIRAVIAESFERIHRSNLVGMGVLPLKFQDGINRKTLGLNGSEIISIDYQDIKPRMEVKVTIDYPDGETKVIDTTCMIETSLEVEYFKSEGILPFIFKKQKQSI